MFEDVGATLRLDGTLQSLQILLGVSMISSRRMCVQRSGGGVPSGHPRDASRCENVSNSNKAESRT